VNEQPTLNHISLTPRYAGVCIEDKLFPKTNSLLEGRAQPLADMNEFALKIQVSGHDNGLTREVRVYDDPCLYAYLQTR